MATRRVSKEQPEVVAAPTEFSFPSNNHLLITCPSRILSWDSSGVNTIFRSSKAGIAAAREAQDGSGVLAIADKQVVVLHDTKRGQEKSWGLQAEQDEVRHLEYTADAKSLFLSTSLTADVQRYSTERSRLLDPTNIHPSPPVALAVSPTGHVIVSASDHPPMVYLKNLAHNSSPTLIEPRASRAAVSVVMFHPERANIFLLAFRDGTVAAYDSARIGRRSGGQLADQHGVSHGQVSCFSKLHRATIDGSGPASITGAAFLPGFKTRAVTVGSDGRCRIIDFAGKGEILRTWHAKAPVTSVSVLSVKDRNSLRSPFTRNGAPHTIGGPTSVDNILAVGRADGVVHLYDSIGLLLEHKSLSEDGEKVISAEWIKGPSPRPISETIVASSASQAPSVPLRSTRRKTLIRSGKGIVEPRTLQQAADSSAPPTRKFTIHPDEAEEGTVRHTPMRGDTQIPPPDHGTYLDLFSPVKPAETRFDETSELHVASSPRSRPGISSQTFVKSPEPAPAADKGQIAKPRNIALFPSTDATDDTIPSDLNPHPMPAIPGPITSAQRQRLVWKPSDRRCSRKSVGAKTLPVLPNNNAKVLADLRKMSTARAKDHAGGVLGAFRHTQASRGGITVKRVVVNSSRHRTKHLETDLDSLAALQEHDSLHREADWVEDSEQDDPIGGDIWMTSDCDDDTTRKAWRMKSAAPDRPPARQSSRSRVASRGTVSTAGRARTAEPATLRNIDGSTDEDHDSMQTTQSHISPSGNFSPSSNDVRQLFPRTSSLSPRKHKHAKHGGSPAKRSRRALDPAASEKRTLREMTPNTAHLRQPKSPWEKMRASKAARPPVQCDIPVQVVGGAQTHGTDGTSAAEDEGPEPHCTVCQPTRTRVVGLEGEVARLRGEVLALRAVLRRNGLQVPRTTE